MLRKIHILISFNFRSVGSKPGFRKDEDVQCLLQRLKTRYEIFLVTLDFFLGLYDFSRVMRKLAV